MARFDRDGIRRLDSWPSSLENQQAIEEMDAEEFVTKLKERGVSADPQKRTPELWNGDLKT